MQFKSIRLTLLLTLLSAASATYAVTSPPQSLVFQFAIDNQTPTPISDECIGSGSPNFKLDYRSIIFTPKQIPTKTGPPENNIVKIYLDKKLICEVNVPVNVLPPGWEKGSTDYQIDIIYIPPIQNTNPKECLVENVKYGKYLASARVTVKIDK